MNRRIVKTTGATTTKYAYDGMNAVQERSTLTFVTTNIKHGVLLALCIVGACLTAGPALANEKITALKQHLTQPNSAIRSVLIARDGSSVFEHYRADVDSGSLHNVRSVTKSVVSLLVGIALDKGLIKSIDEPLLDFFPGVALVNPDPQLTQLRLSHLLTLHSGFDHSDSNYATDYGVFERLFYSPQFLSHALSRKFTFAPGTKFHYSNIDTHLAALALTTRTGMSLETMARRWLFEPLGITHFEWPRSAQGVNNGASELRLSASDLMKLGQLVLQQGRWQDKELISSAYLRKATSRLVQADIPPRGRPELWGYGYLWRASSAYGDDLPATYAVGYGGQFIYLVPALNVVVVATTDAHSREVAAKTAAMIREFALPAARSGP